MTEQERNAEIARIKGVLRSIKRPLRVSDWTFELKTKLEVLEYRAYLARPSRKVGIPDGDVFGR